MKQPSEREEREPLIGDQARGHVNELVTLLTRHALTDGAQPTIVPSLFTYRAQIASEPVHTVYKPSLCFVAQGSKVVSLGDEVLRYDPEHFLLVAVNLPIASQILTASPEKPHLALHIELDLGLIAALIAELDLSPPEPKLPTEAGFSVSVLDPLLRDAVTRLVRLLDTPDHVPTLAPLTLREISYLLLSGPQGARLREMALTTGPTHRVATAIERLVEHYDQPLKVEQLAEEVYMSVSSFHSHFKAVTKLSPLQFQKQLRLQEARRLLLSQAFDVTGASFQVGYESPSQFSREYRRLFGVPPSQDAARFRRDIPLPGIS
jgi:AraC-like DNA-binding protein